MYGSTNVYGEAASKFDASRAAAADTIQLIASKAFQLEKLCQMLGTAHDDSSSHLRERLHSLETETNALVQKAKLQLKVLQDLSRSSSDRAQRLQVEKMMSDFGATVRWYSSLQKQTAAKAKIVMSSSSDLGNNQSDLAANNHMFSSDDPFDIANLQQMQRQKEMTALSGVREEVHERAAAVRQLEADVLDINEIMKDLAQLVGQQGEVIDSIEQNVDAAYEGVERGYQEIQSAERYQRSARKRTCCLVILLAVIVIVLALVIYFSLNPPGVHRK